MFNSPIVFYALIVVVIWAIYISRRKYIASRNLSIQKEEFDAGLTEPASLHPVIDPSVCLGCAACVPACPEKNVLGIINEKAQLISPTNCIGHGACRTACPVDAITLVFGTEKRGVDIPLVQPDFQTNVPGIYIAGELGGMGLIRNAIEQGRQAMETISQRIESVEKSGDIHDVIIIGAGPAGFSASLAAKSNNLNYITVEQDTLGGTVSHYPRGKVVMTAPALLPIIGKTYFKETTKEELLTFWQQVERKTNLKINYQEHVKKITVQQDFITVQSDKSEYNTLSVLLAIGRRGTPRKLNVPGEELPKVVYKLIDPEQYRGQHVLIVGGGDSALEAAHSIADVPDSTVTLSYRSDAFTRAKRKNRDKVERYRIENKLTVLMCSQIQEILPEEVILNQQDKRIVLQNDCVIVCAGGILPTAFLKEIGIEIETKYGTT